LGRAVGLSDSDIHLLRRAAFLKDVGKSGIPDEVLNNAVSWSQAERKTISERMALPWTQDRVDTSTPRLQPIIRHCRENFDGTGSPDKLSGDQIPLGSRLLSIVVAYDALTSQRPFRSAHSDSDARAVLLEGCGKQWDPQYVHVYLTCLDQVSNSSNCSNTVDLLAA
jgi:response regulator RpfG family c-di-GMP phosphodiesterase